MKISTNSESLIKGEFNWKVFFMTFMSIFIVVSLQLLGVRAPKILSYEVKKTSLSENIEYKLKRITNNFEIKEKSQNNYSSDYLFRPNNAKSYAIIDFDKGDLIAEKNSSEKLAIASLTKIMTAVVALDLANLGDEFTVSKRAALQQPTKIGVVPGQRMKLEELINALLLTSANDAAYVIKEGIDNKYGNNIFIQSMNEKAKLIGLKNTHFSNPAGFDSLNNYSSAKDLVILTHYALENYPFFAKTVSKDYEFLPASQNHKQFDLYNWNGLLGVYPNVLGVKIGNTNSALETTIVLSERQGKKVLVVLLGAPGIIERDLWAADLLNFGFAKSINLPPVNITEQDLMQKYSTWRYEV